MVGQNEINQSNSTSNKGFEHYYSVRIDNNWDETNGFYIEFKDPKDTDGSVRQRSTPSQGTGSQPGFETELFKENGSKGVGRVVGNSIEIAIDCSTLIGSGDPDVLLAWATFEAAKGDHGNAQLFRNDKHSCAQAGSPYVSTGCGPTQNIDEVDTLLTPIPAAAFLFAPAVLGLGVAARRKRQALQAA